MKHCINCGKKINKSTRFCPYCGKKQPLIKSTNSNTKSHYKISKNGVKYITDDDASPKQKSKHSKIALLTIAVLVIIGLIIFGGIKIHDRMQMVNLPSDFENRAIDFNGNREQPPVTLYMHTDTISLTQNFSSNDSDQENYSVIGVHQTNINGLAGTKISLRPSNGHSPLSSIFLSNQGKLYTQTSNNSNMYPRNHR